MRNLDWSVLLNVLSRKCRGHLRRHFEVYVHKNVRKRGLVFLNSFFCPRSKFRLKKFRWKYSNCWGILFRPQYNYCVKFFFLLFNCTVSSISCKVTKMQWRRIKVDLSRSSVKHETYTLALRTYSFCLNSWSRVESGECQGNSDWKLSSRHLTQSATTAALRVKVWSDRVFNNLYDQDFLQIVPQPHCKFSLLTSEFLRRILFKYIMFWYLIRICCFHLTFLRIKFIAKKKTNVYIITKICEILLKAINMSSTNRYKRHLELADDEAMTRHTRSCSGYNELY